MTDFTEEQIVSIINNPPSADNACSRALVEAIENIDAALFTGLPSLEELTFLEAHLTRWRNRIAVDREIQASDFIDEDPPC